MKMVINVPVSWMVATDMKIEVEGETKEECLKKAVAEAKKVEEGEADLPSNPEYVDGSFEISMDCLEEMNP